LLQVVEGAQESIGWQKASRALGRKRECMGIEPTESFVQTLHWF
jgi:hypothetical protein